MSTGISLFISLFNYFVGAFNLFLFAINPNRTAWTLLMVAFNITVGVIWAFNWRRLTKEYKENNEHYI